MHCKPVTCLAVVGYEATMARSSVVQGYVCCNWMTACSLSRCNVSTHPAVVCQYDCYTARSCPLDPVLCTAGGAAPVALHSTEVPPCPSALHQPTCNPADSGRCVSRWHRTWSTFWPPGAARCGCSTTASRRSTPFRGCAAPCATTPRCAAVCSYTAAQLQSSYGTCHSHRKGELGR